MNSSLSSATSSDLDAELKSRGIEALNETLAMTSVERRFAELSMPIKIMKPEEKPTVDRSVKSLARGTALQRPDGKART